MKKLCRSAIPAAILAVVILLGFVQQVPAQTAPILVGTTGACNNDFPGGPCNQKSTLVQLDPATGAGIRVIGPVGFTVNGLAWDIKTQKLYASTSIGDTTFHGLITISLATGKGKPVNKAVVNFGLPTDTGDSPVHSITINSSGNMVGWYDEKIPPAPSDTFVQINKKTGVATEFENTGINTSQNGLSFDNKDQLWNIDSPHANSQTAFHLDPSNGTLIDFIDLDVPTTAALGDFNPVDNFYYGLNFTAFSVPTTFLVQVDLGSGSVTTVGQTVDNLHTIAFVVLKP
jgi:hypothetical protein